MLAVQGRRARGGLQDVDAGVLGGFPVAVRGLGVELLGHGAVDGESGFCPELREEG